MNKFRNNLHSAFFDENVDKPKKLEVSETQEVERELEKLQQPILDDFKKSGEKILSDINSGKETEITSRYDQTQQLIEDSRRFSKRVIENKEVWNKKITAGFGGLIQALKNDGYFKNKKLEGDNLKKEINNIKELYWKEVKKQYIENVWFGEKDDEKFNKTKDKLFDIDDPNSNSPAEKIYCELTGAATISRVSRTYMEGYEAEIVAWEDDSNDKLSDRQDRNFLGDELTEYLWSIKGKSVGNLNLGIVSISEERPSKLDRKAIKYFLKYSSKINFVNKEDGRDKAVALMEAFRDNNLNTNSGENKYEEVLRNHGINVDKKYLDNIVKAGNFYINTQKANNSAKDQHAIYLSVLKIIENEGGVKNTVKRFKSVVEKGKQDKETEKQEGYKNGEVLKSENNDIYKFAAEKLKIKDFTSATRLLNRKNEKKDYFKKNSAEKILANLNNDRVISAGDVASEGYKTGAQFLEIFRQVSMELGDTKVVDEKTGEETTITGSDKALNNLLERAKLENNLRGLGLDENSFTKEKINQGDLKLILLLQNIISNPGEDLYTLLSGVEGGKKGPFEGLDLNKLEEVGKIKEEAFKEAGVILSKKEFIENYKNLFKGQDVEIQNFADLQGSLASCLYDNYKMGLGAGSTLTFNEWAKGLQIGAGAQVRGDGAVFGLNISYDHDFYVGKGWTLTSGVSGKLFLPVISGNHKLLGGVGLHVTADEKKIDRDTGTVSHYGFDTGFDIFTDTAYVGRHDKWNRAEGVEEAAKVQSEVFEKVVMWKLLDDITREANGKLDLTNSKVKKAIEKAVEEQKDIKVEDRNTVVDGMLTMLAPYNNADLTQTGVKYAIAEGVAQKYGRSWAEARKEAISQNVYRSGYSVGIFWVVGTPKVGAYAQAYFTKHDKDGGADVGGREYEIDQEYQGEWNEDMLKNFNDKLGLSENNKIKLENRFIVIPKSLAHRVNVNGKMKGLMKKDDEGNILLDTHTPMTRNTDTMGVRHGSEIIIGGRGGENPKFVKLDTLGDAWFAAENINQDEVLNLGEGIKKYNLDVLNKAIDNLNRKLPEGRSIQRLVDSEQTTQLIAQLNEINAKNKKAKLTIIDKNGEVEFQSPVEGAEGRGLELEYKSNFEMIDSDAKKIANDVYAEALKVHNPKVLNDVKHEPWNEWNDLESAYNTLVKEGAGENNQNETTAKEKVKAIFTKLDKKIKGANFSRILDEKFNGLTGDALVQALMSIKNIFARSKQVRGGNEDYEFKRPKGAPKEMRAIIGERYKILNTLEGRKDIDDQAKLRYRQLFDATADYVKDTKNGYAIKSTQAAPLGNTVGFNLGDKEKPENPLFNPEIYNPMVDLDKLETEKFPKTAREGLHKHAMELFAKNPALINPALQAVGIDTSNLNLQELVKSENMKINGDKCELTLDINDKKYTLSTGMKFGFFTQCVNHTIILDNISIAGEDGTNVTFNSGVWENDRLNERDYSSILSSTVVGVGIAVAGGGEDKDNKLKTEGEVENTGKLPGTNTQLNGQDDKKTGGSGNGKGDNSGNLGQEFGS